MRLQRNRYNQLVFYATTVSFLKVSITIIKLKKVGKCYFPLINFKNKHFTGPSLNTEKRWRAGYLVVFISCNSEIAYLCAQS